ncbi:MAG: diaminopimelate epimerase, partial [Verrucomicrobiota bacterium]
ALMAEPPENVSFEPLAGILAAEMIDDSIRIAMSDPFDLQLEMDASVPGLDSPLQSLNTGVPHVVAFVDDLEGADVIKHGAAIRYHDAFSPNGTNANFATVLAPDHIAIRTYERGVEDETLACGTGMVASALLHHLKTGAPSPIKVDVKGGDTLEIGFEKDGEQGFKNVTLTGPADFVFEGDIEI